MRRRAKRLGHGGQQAFGFPENVARGSPEAPGDDWFREDHPRGLEANGKPLELYLREIQLHWVLRLRRVLEELDYGLLTRSYHPVGRKALHPRVLLGLIVYGLLNRRTSLRDLEGLAGRDVGAWWICGGHQPDHSTIGNFIQRHAEILTTEFFVALAAEVVRRLRLRPGTVAGDGTVIEAAAGYYKGLQAEAAEQARAAAAGGARQPQGATTVAQAVAARAADQTAHGRHRGTVLVAPGEPEAVVQPTKDDRLRPAYKPSIWVHEAGVIVGQVVHPSSETAALPALRSQHQAIFGSDPSTLLLDAGFFSLGVLQTCVAAEIDVLCPAGKTTADATWEKDTGGVWFGKNRFVYDPVQDAYHCPAGRTLTYVDAGTNERGGRYRRYRGRQCGGCPLRTQCTPSRTGRTVKRYEGDELKEAMLTVLQHPRARAKYRERSVLAEPPFAELRERQGLKRFHRRGLRGVQVEFALHCIAFNLKKAVHHATVVVVAAAYWRSGGGWRPIAVVLVRGVHHA